jgi:hypothetical protein
MAKFVWSEAPSPPATLLPLYVGQKAYGALAAMDNNCRGQLCSCAVAALPMQSDPFGATRLRLISMGVS